MTLLEMLVVLTLMSFVALLLGQALAQIARIERTLEGAQLDGVALAVKAGWLRSSMESILPAGQNSTDRLVGDERSFKALVVDPPAMPALGLVRLSLKLQYDVRRGITELRMSHDATNNTKGSSIETEAPVEVVLLEWPGQKGSVGYLDAQGIWLTEWPPTSRDPPLLPRAIGIVTGLDELPRIVANLPVTPQVMPMRRELDSAQ